MKSVRSVVFGLLLALVMSAGVSLVSAQNSTVEPFLGPTSTLMSRIGSLAIGSSSIPNWFSYDSACTTFDHLLTMNYTCLDVAGGGVFSNIVVNQNAHVLETVTVTNLALYNPSERSLIGILPALLIEAVGVNDSMLIQGLGRVNGGNNFAPVDTTTQREVCATASGTLTICSG